MTCTLSLAMQNTILGDSDSAWDRLSKRAKNSKPRGWNERRRDGVLPQIRSCKAPYAPGRNRDQLYRYTHRSLHVTLSPDIAERPTATRVDTITYHSSRRDTVSPLASAVSSSIDASNSCAQIPSRSARATPTVFDEIDCDDDAPSDTISTLHRSCAMDGDSV